MGHNPRRPASVGLARGRHDQTTPEDPMTKPTTAKRPALTDNGDNADLPTGSYVRRYAADYVVVCCGGKVLYGIGGSGEVRVTEYVYGEAKPANGEERNV